MYEQPNLWHANAKRSRALGWVFPSMIIFAYYMILKISSQNVPAGSQFEIFQTLPNIETLIFVALHDVVISLGVIFSCLILSQDLNFGGENRVFASVSC